MDGLIEQVQKETNEEELARFPWAGNLDQWHWMIPNDKLVFNEKKATNLGYTREEIPKDTGFEFFTSKLHPEDYERVMDNMRRHLMNLSPAYEVEYRIQKKNGDYAWYYDRGTVTKRSEDGKPMIICGIVFDISRNKKIKKELSEANNELRYLAQTDDLTSAYNRRYMTEKMEEEMACLNHNDSSFSLMMNLAIRLETSS